jgi:pimeloyl-ACP methyl ester carboxylesterase
MNATWMETMPLLGQASRVRESRMLASRPGVSFLDTRGGRVRICKAPSLAGPRLLFATDGPNVIEHYDELIAVLAGRADVVVFEPPGTGGSAPARGFDFTVDAFTRVCGEVLDTVGPRTLVFPCYLGFVGQALARQMTSQVTRLVTPQTPSWSDLMAWANLVDPRRFVRTPVIGQVLMAVSRRRIARGWYHASTGDMRFREPFTRSANEAFAHGGCFCLASLMQGYERSPAPVAAALPVKTAVVYGARDRTHKRSHFDASTPGAEVVRFDACGHCPDLEDPHGFADWLLAWHEGTS